MPGLVALADAHSDLQHDLVQIVQKTVKPVNTYFEAKNKKVVRTKGYLCKL